MTKYKIWKELSAKVLGALRTFNGELKAGQERSSYETRPKFSHTRREKKSIGALKELQWSTEGATFA
jgi:hypothetical protein